MNQPATVEEQLDSPDASQATVGTEAKNPLLDKPLDKTKAPAITMARFGLAEAVRNIWHATVPVEVTPKEVMDEAYWCNVSMHFKPGDEIIVFPDNMAWKLVLHVIGAGKLWAHVAKLHFHDLAQVKPHEKLPSIYKIEYAGTHHQWRVLREGKELRDSFQTEALANRWAANHEMSVNR